MSREAPCSTCPGLRMQLQMAREDVSEGKSALRSIALMIEAEREKQTMKRDVLLDRLRYRALEAVEYRR
jgi:hypothetical protein